MAFPPNFLEELRQRLSLASAVSRRVKLQRRGRDFVGLCPFHKEKTPSFNVVEEKGFYHCFGCGAHGDVISFSMQTSGLSFPEAVESLAREAGMEVPRASPEERQREQRRATLRGALDAATAFFEEQLHAPAGRDALAYLKKRGLDADTVRRFRLGYAPESRNALKRALAKDFPEPLLIEAGLVRAGEEGRESYDYFRNRVIFPIGDRGGRIIAFGGRVLGDGEPKYLNSPETPLFEKGRVLYGWAQARAAAGGGRGPVIVAEGYMDVIALQQAGFVGAVAPLGTALTERQIEELWRIAPEPILCFDGDSAGLRAAGRAVGRALPLLKPGLTLRFATLPAGEDPDTLVLRHGVPAMREVLDRARPLVEFLWTLETQAGPLDTPERRAALEQRLDERCREIADRTVQGHYHSFIKDRLYQHFRGQKGPARRFQPGAFQRGGSGPRRPRSGPNLVEAPPPPPVAASRRQEEVLLAVPLNHPDLLAKVAEDLAHLEFSAPDLDRLCHEILNTYHRFPDLDADTLQLHLSQHGYAVAVEKLLSPEVLGHAPFARREVEADFALRGWYDARTQFFNRQRPAQVAEMERQLAGDLSEGGGGDSWARFQAHQEETEKEREDEGKAVGGLID
jgi:DNA primase